MAQNGVGAVVERLERWDHAATTDPDGEGREELGWQLAGQLMLELRLGKEEAGASKVFEKFLIIESTEISSVCKNSLGNTIGAPKTASAGERTVSFLGYSRSPRSTKGNSSDHVSTVRCVSAVFRLLRSTQDDKEVFADVRCEASCKV
jgi:hypothetical protein